MTEFLHDVTETENMFYPAAHYFSTQVVALYFLTMALQPIPEFQQSPLQTQVLSLCSGSLLLVLCHSLFHHLQNLLHSFRQQLFHSGIQALNFGHFFVLVQIIIVNEESLYLISHMSCQNYFAPTNGHLIKIIKSNPAKGSQKATSVLQDKSRHI